jgi:hypothetical protein
MRLAVVSRMFTRQPRQQAAAPGVNTGNVQPTPEQAFAITSEETDEDSEETEIVTVSSEPGIGADNKQRITSAGISASDGSKKKRRRRH